MSRFPGGKWKIGLPPDDRIVFQFYDEYLREVGLGTVLHRVVGINFDREVVSSRILPDRTNRETWFLHDLFERPIQCLPDLRGPTILRFGVVWIDEHALLSPVLRRSLRISVLESPDNALDLELVPGGVEVHERTFVGAPPNVSSHDRVALGEGVLLLDPEVGEGVEAPLPELDNSISAAKHPARECGIVLDVVLGDQPVDRIEVLLGEHPLVEFTNVVGFRLVSCCHCTLTTNSRREAITQIRLC